jgi:protein-S-isoprenylcysteine O-methyltransferase Ste14
MWRRALPTLGSIVFLVLAPGTVAGFVPWWMSRWRIQDPLLGLEFLRWIGIALILAGAAILVEAFARFAWHGFGTPAPVFPTKKLVTTGLYRYVRNPMYVAVTAVIFGEGLLLGNAKLIGYGACVWLAFFVFVLAYEEPTLRRTYGGEYAAFCAVVPRWIPRISRWRAFPL